MRSSQLCTATPSSTNSRTAMRMLFHILRGRCASAADAHRPLSMWKSIRIAVLLFVLLGVAVHSWLDRIATQGWKETLWVGLFPLNADGTPMAQRYVEGLTVQDFSGIEAFFAREAHRYGVAIE